VNYTVAKHDPGLTIYVPVSGVIWSLFSDLPKDKKKEVMVMLVGEM